MIAAILATLDPHPVLEGWILFLGLDCLALFLLGSVYGAYWLAWVLVGRVSRRVRRRRAEREIEKIRAAWRSGQLPPASLRVGYESEHVELQPVQTYIDGNTEFAFYETAWGEQGRIQ